MNPKIKAAIVAFITGVICILAGSVKADDFFRGGPGVSANGPTGATKIFALRNESYIFKGLYSGTEGGLWTDSRAGNSAAAFGKAQLGVRPGPEEGLYGKAFFGPALITSRDALLGGFFQFATDIGFGVHDRNTSMGICYNHFSSAGLASPNHGRDYIVFEMGLRW